MRRCWDAPRRTENILSDYLLLSTTFLAFFLSISGFKTTQSNLRHKNFNVNLHDNWHSHVNLPWIMEFLDFAVSESRLQEQSPRDGF